ncbi:MAG: hypothetical protein KatS3mg022_1562 [Armatimonadota bacterium]|nr:MAG: hypothetical protein KatS3mg022_1562 [Armatimonadota bacterium]
MKSKQVSPAVAAVVIVVVLLIVGVAYWWFGGGAVRKTTETMQPGVSPYPPGYVPGGVSAPSSGNR